MTEVLVATKNDIEEGKSKIVTVEDKRIAVFNIQGTFHAVDNTCVHAGGSLGDGIVEGTTVTCPLHEWKFDVKTGNCTTPGNCSVKTYDVVVKGGEIFLDV